MAAGAPIFAPTHEQHIGHTGGDFGESTLSPDSTPVLKPHMMPVTFPPHSATYISHPWSVYGPAFNRLYKKGLRRRKQSQSLTPEDSSNSSLDDSDSALDDDDSLSAEGWSNLTYAEMPLELLGTIFQQFMYVPRESLDQLAQQRNQARINASMQDFSTLPPQATWHHCQTGSGSFWLGQPSSGGVKRLPGRRAASDTSSSSSHSRRTSVHLSSSTATDPDIDYDGEDDEFTEVDSDSGDETRSKTWDAAGMLAHKMSNLAMDNSEKQNTWTPRVNNIEEEDSGSNSSGSHDIGYRYRNESTGDTLTDEDDSEGSVNGTSRSASRSPTIAMSGGGSPKTFFHSGLDQVHCHQMCSDTYVPPPVPGHGINRVDNILPEAEMLDELHRDQFFHPTTHTSLHSDLYNCSLVNNQWRIAALQLLWQSVVLDVESCRPEPTDPCLHCTQFQTAKLDRPRSVSSVSETSTCSPSSSSSSASSPRTLSPTHDYSPVRRTRLEVMLDSYMELYGLDLAKCVQTVELDLRLLTWPAEGESVKRILRRLSPFTHLRLVWAEGESPEELIAGFRIAMEYLHPQIRHLHFLSGFVISKSWTQEMEMMTRLETITLEQLGSLEVIEYDWQRIRCLRLNAVIPRGIFQYPAEMMPVQGIEYPVTTYVTDGTMAVATTGAPAQQVSDEMVDQGAGWQGMGLPASGWWQWTGLRKIEIRMRNAVLPSEWLQDLTNVIAENSLTLCQHYGHADSDPLVVASGDSSPMLLGPPLEVLNIDCEVSHPHKDVFALLVHAWGHRFEEFHFTQSDELTDEFFLLCMQKMTRVKKLSLRESKGITGEGLVGIMDIAPEDLSTPGIDKVPIMLRPDFLELNLDQSRIRGDFLKTLQRQCPTAQYKVREVR